jgi:predicted Zn-dependent protease
VRIGEVIVQFKRITGLAISAVAVFSLTILAPREADAQGFEFIRDAEIENTLRQYANPLFAQAGVDPNAVEIHLVKDQSLNAFVAEGLNLFINTGTIIQAEEPGQLIGVIAHECGHIAGGHLVRGQEAMGNAMTTGLAAMILGAAAAIAAGRQDQSAMRQGVPGAYQQAANNSALLPAVMGAAGEVAYKSYASFSRTIEGSADTAGLQFLDNLHMSARGLLTFMEKLEGEELLVTTRQDPYVRTHPLTSDRIDEIRNHVEHSPWSDVPTPPEFTEPHQRMRAKLDAFLNPPMSILYKYKESDTSISARYARAIAYYRIPDLNHALPLIDGLIAERPGDPYFHELRGQILYENGRPLEAIPEYKAAVKVLPDNALLRQELGQVEVESEDPAQLADAKEQLHAAIRKEPDDPGTWRLLATAYGRDGDEAMAAAGMAEYALLVGRFSEATFQANKALKGLKHGTPMAIRMEDVRAQAEQHQDEKNR